LEKIKCVVFTLPQKAKMDYAQAHLMRNWSTLYYHMCYTYGPALVLGFLFSASAGALLRPFCFSSPLQPARHKDLQKAMQS